MKSNFLTVILAAVLGAVLTMGNEPASPRVPLNIEGHAVNPGQQHSAELPWTRFGGATSTFTVATTTPDVSHRTLALFRADTANRVEKRDARWQGVIFRCCSATNNELNTFDVYLCVGDTETMFRVGTLAFRTGLQSSAISGKTLADTVTITNDSNAWFYNWRPFSPADDSVAMAMLDVGPALYIGVCPTTIGASGSAVVEISGF